ncbi:MAG: thiamine pyrophosphate-dependent enzyme [Parvicellaceae bacterium]|tara:strand:+ start:145 stop:2097 length:1953 start_codon:yes stop_codon:yes gene_type:complete
MTNPEIINALKALLLPRLIEEKMLILLRQGKISKWFSGIGQEAISVGSTLAMDKDEFILPMHRNLGVFTTRDVDLFQLFCQFQGKKEGFTKGRDRSFHFGTMKHKVVGMISHLGPQLGIACGVALAEKIEKTNRSVLVFSGDGGASEGDFHEALNVASVWQLPVIFVIENNQWGLSTPSKEQFNCKQFIDKGIGYGMKTEQVDGNNILEVYDYIKKVKLSQSKKPEPFLVEALTFRMRGHEEASGTKYYPKGLQDKWKTKDPILKLETEILKKNILTENEIQESKKNIKEAINIAWLKAFETPKLKADLNSELGDIYKKHSNNETYSKENKKEIRFIDALSQGLFQGMERFENSIIMGQDIAEYGGVFKMTEGFLEKFGKDRVRNTPLCESAIVGAALGLSLKNKKAIMEMQFADFVTVGFNQIVNNLAKLHYRWGQNADVVIRMPTGAGVGAGPFHSQSNEAWFSHTPGLKVLYPSNPEDAKGLMLAAIEDPNPVMIFEHKALYRSLTGMVPENYYLTPIGKAKLVEEGKELSIITYGMGVHWAKKAIKEKNISADILDLRTLLPLDKESIFESVIKTNKVLVLHEDCLTGGIGGEISSLINENCFESLDAPVIRCASMDTPVPFASDLEEQFLANKNLNEKIDYLINY